MDLTPPPSIKQHLGGGAVDGSGGVTAEGGGPGGTGGVIGHGGAIGTGGSGAGGVPGTGGATPGDAAIPDAPGTGGKIDDDASIGTGGISGVGGSTTAGGAPGLGGTISGQGGSATDGPAGTGGLSAGGVVGTGGGTSVTGGTVGTGGVVGTGGARTGGVVGTGGAGTGGVVGTGGAGTGGAGTGGVVGTGGSSAVLNCAAAIVPANSSTNGLVTNFSDWDSTTLRWGSASNLNGTIFQYTDGNASTTMVAAASTAGLNLTGKVASWAGGGMSFLECATVASFTQVQFTIANRTASACTVDMQIQTFALRPMEQVPAGGCKADGGTCYGFPTKTGIVSLSATFAAKPVTATLGGTGNFSNWSTANANQVVGVQWQFGGSANCPIDVTISGVKFL